MKFMNKRSTLISAVMASLIIIGGIFSLVGCDNNSSSTTGGNISGDISDSSQAGGGEQSEDNGSDVLENAQTTTSFNQVTEAEQPKPNLGGNASSQSTEEAVSKEPVYKMDGLRNRSVIFADLVPDEKRAYTFWVYFNENMPDLEIVGPSSVYHISGKDWVIEHGEYVLEDIATYTSVASLTLINPEGGEWYRSWISHNKTPFSFMVTESWV